MEVTAQSVAKFLDDGTAQVTKCSRFSGVKCFLEDCAMRGLMPSLHLTAPSKPKERREPYVFTHSQIWAMLRAAEQCQQRAFDLDGKTLRMVVLLLYATGASLDEVLSLRAMDFDRRKHTLNLKGTTSRPQRLLPISKDLNEQLSAYLAAKRSHNDTATGALVLTTLAGRPLGRGHLSERFKLLQRLANAANSGDAEKGLPRRAGRMLDLRYTFAVHRLQSWISAGKELHKLTPALSAYMGYASLMKSEDFLAYTPERFKGDLRKLLRDHEPTWTSDMSVLDFLARL